MTLDEMFDAQNQNQIELENLVKRLMEENMTLKEKLRDWEMRESTVVFPYSDCIACGRTACPRLLAE